MSDQQNLVVLEGHVPDEHTKSRRRYVLAGMSTLANVGSKGLSLLVLYVSVPLTISYLGPARFGVWMTLASLISFLGFLDFGIGSSLLNEVAHHSAQADRERLKQVVTHGLLLLTFVGLVLGALLYGSASYLPLQALFDSKASIDKLELRHAAQALAVMIGFSLPLVGIQRVFAGLQRAFLYHILFGVGSLISLGLLVMLSHQHAPIDELLLATFGIQLLATTPLLGVLVYRGQIGGFERIAFEHDARALLGHGVLFFVLAVGGAVMWDSDYIIISKVVGSGAVAVYAVAVRMFQLVQLPLQMVNAPLWPAYADALANGARDFLRRTLLLAVAGTTVAATLGVILLVVFHEVLIRVWVHAAVTLPLGLICPMAAWVVIQCSGNAFAMYLNGVRVVRAQVITVIIVCSVALPAKLYLAGRLGPQGVIWGSMGAYLTCVSFCYLWLFRKSCFAEISTVSAI